MITVGSLFTGYGGLDMATNLIWDTKLEWYAEIMPPACRILAHHHPNAPPPPTVTGRNGNQQVNPPFIEWAMGLPEGHVTNPAPN
jgi:DNA (cytosine-5)-methyltransferase 1